MKKEFRKIFRSYMDLEENIEEDILEYFKQRIQDNKETLEELIKINIKAKKEYKIEKDTFPLFNINDKEITYEEIFDLIHKEEKTIGNYKYSNNMIINSENFVLAKIDMPIGIIGVITGEIREKIKFMLKAITSHNIIDIIDPYYNEHDVFQFLLQLLKICLEKFNIDTNIINCVPIEEYSEKKYQKILNLCDEEYNKLEKLEEKNIVQNKEFLIYIQDEYFKDKIENKKRVEVLEEEDYEKAIEIINKNKYKAVSVYTKRSEIAYFAINEIYSDKIFINTDIDNNEIVDEINQNQDSIKEEIERIRLKNREEIEETPIYITKSIIYKLNEKTKESFKEDEVEKIESQNVALVKFDKKHSIMSKIKNIIIRIIGMVVKK